MREAKTRKQERQRLAEENKKRKKMEYRKRRDARRAAK